MSVVLVLLGVGLLVVPGWLATRGTRVAPAEWCRTVAVCLRTGRLAILIGLTMAAAPVVLHTLGAHHVAHACHQAAHWGVPVPWAAGWVATAALAVVARRSHVARRRDAETLARLRAPAWLGVHSDEHGVDVAVVPAGEALAYAVPGTPDQIVISSRLQNVLGVDELAAVLAHERAHLRHGHHGLLRLATDVDTSFGWSSSVRRSTAALRLAVERWADEEAAAAASGGRQAVRRALAGTVAVSLDTAAAFTSPCTLIERIQALDMPASRPGPRARVAAVGPGLVLCALAVMVVVGSAATTHHGVVGMLGFCVFR